MYVLYFMSVLIFAFGFTSRQNQTPIITFHINLLRFFSFAQIIHTLFFLHYVEEKIDQFKKVQKKILRKKIEKTKSLRFKITYNFIISMHSQVCRERVKIVVKWHSLHAYCKKRLAPVYFVYNFCFNNLHLFFFKPSV